ncbi:hypothetical protein L596_011899 [Steinernema carpocapsae]|uniref:Uncharacterized protein n=1 Tax=Steinernema carpocapsae TaxID=34508 RepID=A0A4U5NW36_STECR|nr:hypothetical protein L596_011899 [Steinernema carpocapsae]
MTQSELQYADMFTTSDVENSPSRSGLCKGNSIYRMCPVFHECFVDCLCLRRSPFHVFFLTPNTSKCLLQAHFLHRLLQRKL